MSTVLTRASRELFARGEDEVFHSLQDLFDHCRREREQSMDRWEMPRRLQPLACPDGLLLNLGLDGAFQMNDWSFGQLCRLAKVNRETVNRVSADTAARIFQETLPRSGKPLQLLTAGDSVRAIHGASYTRLYNSELLEIVQDTAKGFEPAQQGLLGKTGLYCGEQDMFVFLIDPLGWTEIDGEAFAPGFFLWNSEVGRRSVGIETFWFQAVCANHIVWDAVDVTEVSRKHTTNVRSALSDIRHSIRELVARRDARRDHFVSTIRSAMRRTLGDDADAVLNKLAQRGIPRKMAKEAVELASRNGRLTIFSVVDALTRLTGIVRWIGDRTELDQKIGSLLNLAV